MPNVISLFGTGCEKNPPKNSKDYIGRHVSIYHQLYVVTATEKSDFTMLSRKGIPFYPPVKLYAVSTDDYDEYGVRGTWLEASNIAEAGKTIINWHHDSEYKRTLSECGELYAKAIEAEEKRKQARIEENKRHEDRRAEVVAFYKEHTPEWSQAVIYAELRQDDSDSQTDYFSSSAVKKILLGFAKSNRNNFSELRKFALTYDDTKHLATEGKEYRQNYSGGHGYFLAGERSHYSSWLIQKSSYLGTTDIDFSHYLETKGA